MATENVLATALTNLDASPPVNQTPSTGGPAPLRVIDGNVTATSGPTAGSTYKILRVPSAAVMKSAKMKLDASVATFTGDIGFYHSDSTSDNTTSANQGTKVNGNTGSQLFGAAVALAAQTTFLDLMAGIAGAKFDQPLWQVCGLTTDPRDYFDLVITTTATNSGAPVVYAQATYVD